MNSTLFDAPTSDTPTATPPRPTALPDVPAHVRNIHERLLAARRGQRKADFQLAMLLAEMAEGRLFLELGYCSLVNYAEQVLELTPRTTRELLLLARRLPGLPVLSASLESGELDWTKAREIVRVATPDTELAWVERAASVTSRVLEAEVATSLVGELPPTGEPDPERRPERQRVVFEMDSADAEVLRTALAAIRSVTHVGDSGDRSTDSAILAGIARAALVALEKDEVLTGERFVIVLEHCPGCRRTVSPEAEVSDAVAAEAFCDALVLEMRPGPDQGHLTRSVPETTRRKVFHRAHWKCEVPGCGNRLWLDIHHMQPRASGGKHGVENLAAVCCTHHRCIHEGTLGVELKCEVVAPDGGPDGRPGRRVIEVTHGDGRRSRSG
jgi:hypothetical protein